MAYIWRKKIRSNFFLGILCYSKEGEQKKVNSCNDKELELLTAVLEKVREAIVILNSWETRKLRGDLTVL